MTDGSNNDIENLAKELRRWFGRGERDAALTELEIWRSRNPDDAILQEAFEDFTNPKAGRPRKGTDDRAVSMLLDLGEMRKNGIKDEVVVEMICKEQGVSKATFERMLGEGSRIKAKYIIDLIEKWAPGLSPGNSGRIRFAWRQIFPVKEEVHRRNTPYTRIIYESIAGRIHEFKIEKDGKLKEFGIKRYVDSINSCENNCINYNGGICRRNEIEDLEIRSKCPCNYFDQLRVEFRRNY